MAPVIFYLLSWFIISSKVTWMYAVALNTIPGSLVFPESLPGGLGARCLQDPLESRSQATEHRAWSSSEELSGQTHGDGDSFSLCQVGTKNISHFFS